MTGAKFKHPSSVAATDAPTSQQQQQHQHVPADTALQPTPPIQRKLTQTKNLEIPGTANQSSQHTTPSPTSPSSSFAGAPLATPTSRPSSGSASHTTQQQTHDTTFSTAPIRSPIDRPTSAQKKKLISDTTQTPLSAPISPSSSTPPHKSKATHVVVAAGDAGDAGANAAVSVSSTQPQKQSQSKTSPLSRSPTVSGATTSVRPGVLKRSSTISRHNTTTTRPMTTPGAIELTASGIDGMQIDLAIETDTYGISAPMLQRPGSGSTSMDTDKLSPTSPIRSSQVGGETVSSTPSPNQSGNFKHLSVSTSSADTSPSPVLQRTRSRSGSARSKSNTSTDASNAAATTEAIASSQEILIKALQQDNQGLHDIIQSISEQKTHLEKHVKSLEQRETQIREEKEIALRNLENHRRAGANERTNVDALKSQIVEEHAQNAALIVHNRSLKTHICELETVIESLLPTASSDVAKLAAAVLKGLK